MSNDQNPFDAAIAALEARREQVNAEIDADIAKLREIGERMSGVALTSGATLSVPSKIEKDTFYNMTLPDAAKKFLAMCAKKPQTTNAIIDALEKGGLKKTSYASMYTSMSRRENNIGDIINVNGDWGLPEWYGKQPKPKNRNGDRTSQSEVSIKPKDFAEEGETDEAVAQEQDEEKADTGS